MYYHSKHDEQKMKQVTSVGLSLFKLENVLPQGLTLLARSVHVHRSVQQIQVNRGRMLFVPLIVALASANTSHRTRSVSIINTNGSVLMFR